MSERPLLIPGFKRILHGGDYNPDQWQRYPEVLSEDIRLMKLAGCSTFTLGVFSWTSYEPEEGRFSFDWLDRSMDQLAKEGHKVILATPSGAKPAWMSAKYPEIRRVQRNGLRDPHKDRHNHCWSSPVFREKVQIVNRKLAERYQKHPALGMWHISNELAGECLCDLCIAEYQRWLEKKYGTLDALNEAWWAGFWSKTYTSWAQIDPRDPSLDGASLDFRRFTNQQLIDFMLWEMKPLRELTPAVPATTNFMGTHGWMDYAKIAQHVDLVGDDQYPGYDGSSPTLPDTAVAVSFKDDLYRCYKPDRPWMLMECTPDAQQWREPMRLKRPNLHRAEMIQALAHGAEGTCYFQWRKGRGGLEKLHGAVVDHVGHEHTRVFQHVAALGREYETLTPIIGSVNESDVAFIYDWEAKCGFEHTSGADRRNSAYDRTAFAHYRPFWQAGIGVDVLESERDFSSYKLLVTPQLWLLKPGVAERILEFVENGGTWVATQYTAYCDEYNRMLFGGLPGQGLGTVLGIWNEEYDALPDGKTRRIKTAPGNRLKLSGSFEAVELCEVLHLRGATALAHFDEDFYAGQPVITVNEFGKGRAYYVGARFGEDLLSAFYGGLLAELALSGPLEAELPKGVMVQRRVKGSEAFLFVVSFRSEPTRVSLGQREYTSLIDQSPVKGTLELPAFGSAVLRAENAR
jgi:beta-galactosidase